MVTGCSGLWLVLGVVHGCSWQRHWVLCDRALRHCGCCEQGGLGRTWDGGTYHGVMKYTTMMTVICHCLVAMSLLVTWHLNSVLERNG